MTHRLRNTVIATAVAILGLLSVGVSTAMAAWTTQALGAGVATSGDMPAGPAASAAVTGPDVLVSWAAVTLAGGTPSDYVVKRYGAGATAVVPAGDCGGVVTTNECTESGVAEGLWTYTIATAKGTWRGDEGTSSTAVRMPTRAPSDLAADPADATRQSVSLTWMDNSAIEDAYLVERSVDGSTGWSSVASLPANAVSVTDDGVTCGQSFSYRVTAVSAANNDSTPSNVATATAAACPLAPAQPSGLSATAISPTQIDLSWTDNATNEASYKVEVSTDGAATWTTVAGGLAADSESYSDAGLICGTHYDYRVTAIGAEGVDSNASDVAGATTQSCSNPPVAPSDLGATAVSATRIDLIWTDQSLNESHFEVERNGTLLAATAQAGAGTGSVTFQDTVACGTAYTYKVRAVNGDGPSAFTDAATATSLDCAPTVAPASFTATPAGNSVDLAWSNVPRATSYKVERLVDATWTVVATPTGTTYTHALGCGLTGTYRIRGVNNAGDGPESAEQQATTAPCAPAAPAGLIAAAKTVAGGDVSVDLSWTDNATNESGFDIERTGGAGGSVVLARGAATGTGIAAFNDDSAVCGVTYSYRVRSTSASGASAYTGSANAATVPCDATYVAAITTTSAFQGQSNWRATATVTVKDHNGDLVDGAAVTGSWSGGSAQSCTTGSGNLPDGECPLGSGNISNAIGSVTFTITNVATTGRTYASTSNVAVSASQNRP